MEKLRRLVIDKYPELRDIDTDLLALAMTKISRYTPRATRQEQIKKYGSADYQRLEFLGDSVLELITAEILFNKFELDTPRKLTEMKSELVQNASLYCFAKSKNLCSLIQMKIHKDCADFLEALVGAIYYHLKSRVTAPLDFIERWLNTEFEFETRIEELLAHPGSKICDLVRK